MGELLLRGGLPLGMDAPVDILIRDTRIVAVGPGIEGGATEIDVTGQVVLPGLVDAHCHLDKTLMGGPWVPHSAGRSLAEKIDNGQRRRAELGIPSVAYISDLLARMITGGASHVRSHTYIDPEIGLKGVEAVAEAVADRITVEQVAFPQGGLLTNPGTAELLEAALATGVGVIGGLDPAGVDGDPVRHLDIVFGLAERYGAKVDIHLHEGGTLGAWQFDLIVGRTKATGLGGRVTISRAFAIGQVDAERQQQLAERLAEVGVSLVTAAIFNDPVPPITRLLAAGANVAAGNDGIRDLWTPYGDGDMLRRTMHLAYRSGFFRDEDIETALRVATYGGARALGLSEYGLEVGDPADLVVVAAGTPAEAVMSHPPRSQVIKGGRVVARDGRLAYSGEMSPLQKRSIAAKLVVYN